MAISFKRYIDITSGVGGGRGVRARDLIGRIFTSNNLLPPQSFVEFTALEDVGTYFGFTSEEYLRASLYFGFVAKNITAPKKISYARFVNAAVAPMVFGFPADQAVGSYTPITAGSFGLTMGGFTFVMTGLNFSGAVDLAGVATILQTAIRSKTGGGALWTNATVTYDALRKSFNIVGGVTGAAVVAVQAGAGGSDVALQLGWLNVGTILAPGSAVETVTGTLTASADASNNFGSFLFMPVLSLPEKTEAAIWNDAQNVMFQYMVPVILVNAASYNTALKTYAGVAMTLTPISTEYDEMAPMILLAATNYERRNAVKNYMFQEFSLTPKVSTNADANTLDPLRVNYYGRTQTAGQFIDFYQRGVLCGLATDPVDMNTYANEQWLKDNAGSKIMELLLSLERVSANAQGRIQLRTTLQSTIDAALFNGTISVGKILNNTQKLYITELTGDELAWMQVQNIGYWLDVAMLSYVTIDGRTEYKAVYTLIYSKDDTVRKVEGTHVLI